MGLFFCGFCSDHKQNNQKLFWQHDFASRVGKRSGGFSPKWCKRRVLFFEANTDPSILRGCIVEWDYPMDDSGNDVRTVADIYYTHNDTDAMQRFIVCKEMIHLLDGSAIKVSTPDELEDLIEKITKSYNEIDPLKDGEKANNDRFAELKALAILFPLACRDLLLPVYKTGKVTKEEIAKQADIPANCVETVMGDIWPIVYRTFISE